MKKPSFKPVGIAAVATLSCAAALWFFVPARPAVKAATATVAQAAALSVVTTTAQPANWSVSLTANGSIVPWEEAVVGSSLGGLRLVEVLVNVGAVVKRGQRLARFDSESIAAELAQQEAALEEARSALAEAEGNAERARMLSTRGMISTQQSSQILTAERSANARLASAQARLRADQIRLRQTQLVAPDDGIISSRSATLGAVTQQGQELFKLIRQQRLEWRGEVAASDLQRIKPGQLVTLVAANDQVAQGTVRAIGPSIDRATSNAMVYVDLPKGSAVSSGMFASGTFALGSSSALALPQAAVIMRDGYNYVYIVGADNRVAQTKVTLGRRVGERIEIIDGIGAAVPVVAQGAGFLANGDLVKVVLPVRASIPVASAAGVTSVANAQARP